MQKLDYEITSVRKLKDGVKIFKMKPVSAKLAFEAGQFVKLSVPGSADPSLWRAYSIASAPEEGDLEFCIKIVDGGKFTEGVADKLKAGDKICVEGPLGHFTIPPEAKKVCFIAGGTGIAPFIGMLRHAEGRKLDAVGIFSFRTKADIIYNEELRGRKGKTIVTLTREKWDGEMGHVDSAMVRRHVGKPDEFFYFICGPSAMVEAVKKELASLGVGNEKIKVEMWGGK
ncbi:MAG: ferredoxin--NADP reductase [Candidatus Bilamarchaeaceae archaeon]